MKEGEVRRSWIRQEKKGERVRRNTGVEGREEGGAREEVGWMEWEWEWKRGKDGVREKGKERGA